MVVAIITDAMQQAHDIYLRGVTEAACASCSSSSCSSPHPPKQEGGPEGGREVQEHQEYHFQQIERYKEILQNIPAGLPGCHVLVWATFLVAAASTSEEHKNYFRSVLVNIWQRSGFSNLLNGVCRLPEIWARRDGGERWTELLPEARLFLM
jgi:hypothetical protein